MYFQKINTLKMHNCNTVMSKKLEYAVFSGGENTIIVCMIVTLYKAL